jgi:CubicO group peptidase (beta-lactamase class C family)
VLQGHLEPIFAPLAHAFARRYARPRSAGGALAVYLRGEPVVDIWAGCADARTARPWTQDTATVCFSTTKGVMAMVLHRLVDRGLLSYEDTVAKHWPDFGQNHKQRVTVRQVLAHLAGLHRVRGLVTDPGEVRDHKHMATVMAAAAPRPWPGTKPGYHAFTFGWIVAGIIEHVTGEDIRTVLARELTEPLGADAMWLGAPEELRAGLARFSPEPAVGDEVLDWVGRRAGGLTLTRGFSEAFLAPGFGSLLFSADIHDTVMPAVNGVFTARSLARMYSVLANDGMLEGRQVLSPDLVREVGRVQTRQRDYVLAWPMRWRLGFHQGFVWRGGAPKAFGHFGFGGSGGWADPETGLALAFVTNRVTATTPVGDARLLRLGTLALRIARDAA